MKTDYQHTQPCSHLKDAVVFLVTVAACTLVLTVACALTQTNEIIAETTPLLAVPQPPDTLELAPEPEPVLPAVEVASMTPVIEVASTAPAVDVVSTTRTVDVAPVDAETIAVISSAPDGAMPSEPIPFHGIIVQVAGRYEVDPHLIRAIILAESGYNPKAKSKKGARGLMQLMPSTAKSLGVQNIYDPEENIDGGVRYFRTLLDRFDGDVQLALAAYNAGSRHVRNYEGIPPFKATQRYVKKVLKFHEKFKTENTGGYRRLA